MGSLRFSLDNKEEGLHRTYSSSAKKQSESDSSGYGAFGLVEIHPDKLDCIEKIGKSGGLIKGWEAQGFPHS